LLTFCWLLQLRLAVVKPLLLRSQSMRDATLTSIWTAASVAGTAALADLAALAAWEERAAPAEWVAPEAVGRGATPAPFVPLART
jgi:hypothetical protein